MVIICRSDIYALIVLIPVLSSIKNRLTAPLYDLPIFDLPHSTLAHAPTSPPLPWPVAVVELITIDAGPPASSLDASRFMLADEVEEQCLIFMYGLLESVHMINCTVVHSMHYFVCCLNPACSCMQRSLNKPSRLPSLI